LIREIIGVCSEIHTKHINTLCGQNVEFVNVKPAGAHSDHWAVTVNYCHNIKTDGKLREGGRAKVPRQRPLVLG
jgi:hypothetical protein